MKECNDDVKGIYKMYRIKFDYSNINDSLIITIITQDSQIFESEIYIKNLKNKKIFESMINTPEIINYLYLRLRNGECYIKQNESNLIIKIFSPLIDSFINETPYRYKIGEYISLKLLTYTKESIIFYKNENELEFICSKKDELKPLYDFFSCIQCKKIVSDAYSCNCPKFLCFKCLQTYTNKNKDCLFRKNNDIDYIILNFLKREK